MPIQDLKSQIARLPEQPGVYLYFNEAGETLYVGKARVLRDRVRSYLGRAGHQPAHRRPARRSRESRVHRHRFGRRGARAREPPDQAARPEIQHPAAGRQELPLPAADHRRGLPAGAHRPAASSRTATSTPARSCRPSSARRTMSLTHRLFGIRSCNEVITGDRARPCLEFDIHRCIAPCVREICAGDAYRGRRAAHPAVPRRAQRRARRRRCGRG